MDSIQEACRATQSLPPQLLGEDISDQMAGQSTRQRSPKKASIPSIYTLLLKAQIRWAGHVVRMDDSRLPKRMLYGELVAGKRNVDRPRKRYKDSLKASLKELSINTTTWENQASNRSAWRTSITKGANTAEAKRIKEAKEKREARRPAMPHSQPLHLASHAASVAEHLIRARNGLFSYLRSHQGER